MQDHGGEVRMTRRERLPALTSLRFFAAALIVFHHSLGYFGIPMTTAGPLILTQGITFFFVLSGFIMLHAYSRLDGLGTLRFYVARIARIWPLHVGAYLLAWLILPAALFIPATFHPAVIAINLALVQQWYLYRPWDSFNNVAWTLSIEAFFYLLFPLLRWRRIGVLLVPALMLIPLASGVLDHFPRPLPAPLVPKLLVFTLFRTPACYLWEFALGMAMAVLFQATRSRLRINRGGATAIECGALLVTAAAMWWSKPLANALIPSGTNAQKIAQNWLVNGFIPALPFAAVLLVLAYGRGWIATALAWHPLVWLGEISYALYLTHNTLIAFYFQHPAAFAWLGGLLYPAYWFAALAVATGCWLFIERPCRRRIVAWADLLLARPAQPAVSSAVQMTFVK